MLHVTTDFCRWRDQNNIFVCLTYHTVVVLGQLSSLWRQLFLCSEQVTCVSVSACNTPYCSTMTSKIRCKLQVTVQKTYSIFQFHIIMLVINQNFIPSIIGPTHRTVWPPVHSYWETSLSCRWVCPPTIPPPPAVSQWSCRLYWMTARLRC